MSNKIKLLLAVAAVLAAPACVSKSKHEATLKQLEACNSSLEQKQAELDNKIKEAEGKIANLTAERDAARKEAADQGDGRRAAEDRLNAISGDLKTTTAELEQLRKQKAEAEKRLAAQRALTERFRKMIDSGKIQIGLRGGLMIVKLPSGVLFDSGKAELSTDGKAVLTEVATVLKEFPDRRFVIAGHTDNVPLRGSKYKDNWDLSTARALTVTKFLIEQGVSPKSLSASGYGEFDPIADNSTEDGKKENRRIEIILVPNIDELPVDEPPAP